MLVVKGNEIKKIDQTAILRAGISSLQLMEKAAIAFVAAVLPNCFAKQQPILIVCGVGNNGGDGLAIARLLLEKYYKVQVFVIGDPTKMTNDALLNFERLKKSSCPIKCITQEVDLMFLRESLMQESLILDAIFGIGCSRPIEGILKEAIQIINTTGYPVIAVDIPSGIHSDNGQVMGVAIKAHKTITFSLPKIGLYLPPGALMAGDIQVADLGIPRDILEAYGTYERLESAMKANLPQRKVLAHKGTYGKILIIAGSKTMMGAAILSAYSAYRTGCGLVKVMTEKGHEAVLFTQVPEAIVETYEKKEPFDEQLNFIESSLNWADVILMGPGMGNDAYTKRILEKVLSYKTKKIVLDADALNVLSGDLGLLKDREEKVILTPHVGEMSRLTGLSAEIILKDLISAAEDFGLLYGVITVLKSSRTVISDGDKGFINVFGNNGMATAGSGDVLSGMIASLWAQNSTALTSAVLGVLCHSQAGDEARKKVGEYGLIARDIIEAIPIVMR